jgi:predicted ribosomally synthesized peptide with SipW-like signal peptide
MKKKILALALVVAMLAVAIVSASLAYFTDEEYETNTFTLGEIDITLEETFGNEDKDGDGKDETKEFYPGVPVKKEVWVENTSETGNDAYVRVHVAFPVEFAPRKLGNDGITYSYDIYGKDGLAIVTTYEEDANADTDAANKAAYNEDWVWTDVYSANIGSEEDDVYVPCVVFVATYQKKLAAEVKDDDGNVTTTKGVTSDAISAIRLNERADTDIIDGKLHLFMDLSEDGEWDLGELRVDTQGTNPFTIDVEVAAEAVQVEGFDPDTPEFALDTAFGDPGEYNLSTDKDDNEIYWVKINPAIGPAPSYANP